MAAMLLCAASLPAMQACQREYAPQLLNTVHGTQVDAAEAPYCATVPIEDWPGRWNGPEGTALTLTRNAAGYEVRIRNLDGEQVFSGMRVKDHIEFQRDKKLAAIWSGNGGDPGLKWLAGRQRCLIVAPGEGYCRD